MNMIGQRGLHLLVGIAIGAIAVTSLSAQPRPPAFYITQIELTGDADTFVRNYGALVPATLAPYGGKFLVRGAKGIHLEGAPPTTRNAVIQFESLEKAQSWYNSDAYQRLKPVRQQLTKTNSYFVEGVAP